MGKSVRDFKAGEDEENGPGSLDSPSKNRGLGGKNIGSKKPQKSASRGMERAVANLYRFRFDTARDRRLVRAPSESFGRAKNKSRDTFTFKIESPRISRRS